MFYGTFVEISPSDITAMLTHTKNLITDLMPLWLAIVGIGLGLLIFWAIVKSFKS